MDIGAFLVAYIFLSSGVYLAELQTIRMKVKKQLKVDEVKFNDLPTKPSIKSIFARSILAGILLIVTNEGFTHWKDIPYFTLAVIIGFIAYDLVSVISEPKKLIYFIPILGKLVVELEDAKKGEKKDETTKEP